MHNAKTPNQPVIAPAVSGDCPVLSLFSGAGGLDYGFRLAGFRPALAIDISQAAIATYKRNHPGTAAVCLDLATADPSEILGLWENNANGLEPIGIIGGPPCQAFSSSNVHQTRNDPRRKLLWNYARIVKAFTARYGTDFFAMENVPALLQKKHRPVFDEFKAMLETEFKISEEILEAWTFGVPQHRKRLVAVGVSKKRHPSTTLRLSDGDCEVPPPIENVLGDLPEPIFCRPKRDPEDVPYHRNHVAMVPRSKRFRDGSLPAGNSKGLSFKVLAWGAPSYTVAYGNNEIHVHPGCHRRLSIYEAMRLQGFPHAYWLEGTFPEQVRMVSNAVPPPLAEGIATMIARALGYKRNALGPLVSRANS